MHMHGKNQNHTIQIKSFRNLPIKKEKKTPYLHTIKKTRK
jgi:hypothetical protein